MDIAGLRESHAREEFSTIGRIRGDENPAEEFPKPLNRTDNIPLWRLLMSNMFGSWAVGWASIDPVTCALKENPACVDEVDGETVCVTSI